MPEKVRRLPDKTKSSRYKRGLFFIVGLAIVVVGGWLAIKNLWPAAPQNPPQIKDRRMVAAICYETSCFSMNRDGVVFAQISQPSGNLIFRIDDATGRTEPVIGQEVLAPSTLAEVMFFRKEIKNELGVLVTRAVAAEKTLTDFDLYTSPGWLVRVSTKNNAPASVEILRRTLAELATSTLAQLDYIDLRLPARVYYKTR